LSVAYNPKIPTSNIIFYFDAGNEKSFSGDNTWRSLVSSDQVNNFATINGSFLQQDSVQIDKLDISYLDSYSNLSIVVSLISNNTSKGTLFSVYGNNTAQYANSAGIAVSAPTGNTGSTGGTNTGYSYSNSTIITLPVPTGNTGSTGTTNTGYSYANSTIITLPAPTGNTGSTGGTNTGYSYSNSTIITLPAPTGNTGSVSQEIYQDYPDYDISAYFDNSTINTRFKNNSYESIVSEEYVSSNNDIFTFVFKKSTNDYNVKIYQNRNLLVQYDNISNLASFGTNFSFLSRNNQGNVTTAEVRSFLVYDRELTNLEVGTISSAIRKI
jgi:hypothetical protein